MEPLKACVGIIMATAAAAVCGSAHMTATMPHMHIAELMTAVLRITIAPLTLREFWLPPCLGCWVVRGIIAIMLFQMARTYWTRRRQIG